MNALEIRDRRLPHEASPIREREAAAEGACSADAIRHYLILIMYFTVGMFSFKMKPHPGLNRLSDKLYNFHKIFSNIDYYLDFGLATAKPFER